MGLLVGLWYPAFGSALYARVGADERGRVIGWMLALGYMPGYVLTALTPLVNPALLTTAVALCLAVAGAIPLHSGESPTTPAVDGRVVLRPWRRLFIFALIAGPVVGIVRVDVHALLSAPANVHVAQLAAQVAAALLAGTLIDLRGRTRAAGAGVMTLGLSMGLGLLGSGGTAGLLMLLGTGVGVITLEAFWATVLADLSPGYGPAISFGFGHALALLMVGIGAWIGRLLPPVETAGVAILALFVATGLLWGVPETRSAGAARKHPPPPPAPDMASALQLTARQPLTQREMEVALLLIKGVSTAQMADQLFLTMHTIRAHLHRIYSKTETASRHELLARVIAHVSSNPQP
jgi:DNA-binding CsgD family transcriptional regulator